MHDQFLNRKIILIAFVVSISACLQIFKDQFIYWRVDIFPEIWRLWTAHWVHVGWIHFALNMLAFMCLPFIFPRARVWHFVALLLILPPLISLSFYYFRVVHKWLKQVPMLRLGLVKNISYRLF